MRRVHRSLAQQLRSAAWRWHMPLELRAGAGASKPRELCPVATVAVEIDETADRLRRLEAVLFLAREALSSRKLSQYANLADGTAARTLVRRLNQRLDDGHRAFRIDELAGGFQLRTRAKFAQWLRRLEHTPTEVRLSSPAMETLAVVAYRQPVMRAEVEAVRGVSCGEILRQLMDRDLVRVTGRSEELGRPYLYGTTRRFMEVFGLRTLDELPRADLVRSYTAPGELSPAVSGELQRSGLAPDQVVEDSEVSATTEPLVRPHERDQQMAALASSRQKLRADLEDDNSNNDDDELDEYEDELDDDAEADDDFDDDFEDDDDLDEEYDDDFDDDFDDDEEDEWEEVGDDDLDDDKKDDDWEDDDDEAWE